MFVARCPTCATELTVEDADRGQTVACPECRERFVALPPAAKQTVAARRAPVARRWDDDSDYVNDTVVPPRHWLDREDDRGPDPLRVVRRELAGPANGLIWTGWVGFLVLIVGGFLVAVTGYLDLNNPYGSGSRAVLLMILGAVAGTLGSMYFVIIASGGGAMKRVRNRGQAMTTAVMGLCTLLTCTLPIPFASFGTRASLCVMVPLGLLLALPAAGFGLWALIVLSRPEVAEAFARRAKKK